jgi:hypothetical protein
MLKSVSKAEALPEDGGRVYKVHAHYQIVNTTFRKMVNFCYQAYKGKCVKHPHTADINQGPSENSFTSRPKQTGILQT